MYIVGSGMGAPVTVKFYKSSYFFNLFLPIKTNNVLFSSWSQTLSISGIRIPNAFNLWLKEALEILYLTNSYYFNKVKFRGKGYYIYKGLRSTIAPQFGYAHRIYVYSFFNTVRFLGKTRVLLFGFLKQDVLLVLFGIKKHRPINVFTGRGVRFSKEIIYKKTGKVSSYR